MATVNISLNIEIVTTRCSACSCWWGYETSRSWKDRSCPFCAGESIAKARDEVAQSTRALNSTRGVVTRLKRQLNNLKKNSIPIGKVL